VGDVFTYSEDVTDAIDDVTAAVGRGGLSDWVWVWAPLLLDTVLIMVAWPLKRRIATIDGDKGRPWAWWTAGALLTVAAHLMVIFTEPHQANRATVWPHVAASLMFIIAMGMLLTSALNADPLSLSVPAAANNDLGTGHARTPPCR
jgi:hypothetical protein